MRLRIAVLMCIALLAAACGGSSSPTTEARLENGATPSTGTDEGPTGSGEQKGEATKPKGKKGGGSDKPGTGGSDSTNGDDKGGGGSGLDTGAGDAPGGSGGSGEGNAPSGGTNPAGGGGPRGGSSDALYPPSGRYVFSQSGYEEFCAGTCQREKLPPRQTVTSALASKSGSSAVVVTTMRASNSRMTRTTTRFTRSSADITEVYIRFAYSGYKMEQTYRPQPPVESIRFPFVNGESWRTSWKADVSGDYSAAVQGRETVNVNGRAVEAAKLQTTTHFRGDFEGTAHATLWVDPKTKAIVKTAGNLAVDSNFGSYETGFATVLASGPGY